MTLTGFHHVRDVCQPLCGTYDEKKSQGRASYTTCFRYMGHFRNSMLHRRVWLKAISREAETVAGLRAKNQVRRRVAVCLNRLEKYLFVLTSRTMYFCALNTNAAHAHTQNHDTVKASHARSVSSRRTKNINYNYTSFEKCCIYLS